MSKSDHDSLSGSTDPEANSKPPLEPTSTPVNFEDLKTRAELRKIEAEIDVLKDERDKIKAETAALQPKRWFRSQWFWGGALSIPLMWFFFQNIVIPISKTESIKDKLAHAEAQDTLKNQKDTLEEEKQSLLIGLDHLKSEKEKLSRQRDSLDAGKQALEATLSELKERHRLTQDEYADLQQRVASINNKNKNTAVQYQTCSRALEAHRQAFYEEEGKTRIEATLRRFKAEGKLKDLPSGVREGIAQYELELEGIERMLRVREQGLSRGKLAFVPGGWDD